MINAKIAHTVDSGPACGILNKEDALDKFIAHALDISHGTNLGETVEFTRVFSCTIAGGYKLLDQTYGLYVTNPRVRAVVVEPSHGALLIHVTVDASDEESGAILAQAQAEDTRMWLLAWAAIYLEPANQIKPIPPPAPQRWPVLLATEEPLVFRDGT